MNLRWNSVVLGVMGVSAVSLLMGCSAANGIINSNIPAMDNLLQLDNQSVEATIGATRLVTVTTASRTVNFGNRSLQEANRLNKVRFEQGLSDEVTVTAPSTGARLNDSFSLSNIRLDLSVSDAGREVGVSRTIAGPVTLKRIGTTSTFQISTPVTFSDMEISGSEFGTFRDIVTGGGDPNTARGQVRFDSDPAELPVGTVLTFRFAGGKARVQI